MKKLLLSLSALFAVSMASAQSYIKQPDPSTYQVVEHKAQPAQDNQQGPAATEETPAQPAETTTVQGKPATAGAKQPEATPAKTQQPATAPDNKVAENKRR